jgi:hypothetical protein
MPKTVDPSTIQPLLIAADDIPALLGCPGICKATIHKLRRRSQWPRLFFIGGRLYARRSDVELFIEQQVSGYEEQHARHQAHGRKAIHTRWRKAEQEPVP